MVDAMKHTNKEKQLTSIALSKRGLANILANSEGITVKARVRATTKARDLANSVLIACLLQGDDEELVGEANQLNWLANEVNQIR